MRNNLVHVRMRRELFTVGPPPRPRQPRLRGRTATRRDRRGLSARTQMFYVEKILLPDVDPL